MIPFPAQLAKYRPNYASIIEYKHGEFYASMQNTEL